MNKIQQKVSSPYPALTLSGKQLIPSSLALADSIWNVSWNKANQIVTSSADGHIRVWDAEELSQPVHDIDSHPLAITSLSVADKKALASSLDGTIVLVDTENGEQLGKVESARVKLPAEGGPGELFWLQVHCELICM